MLISWNWLKRHVDLEGLDPIEVGDLFTLKVAELEGVHAIGAGLEGLRAVLIQSVQPHPNSDKLSLVTVADGDQKQTVVCGAPNAKEGAGRVAVLAPIGCTLPNGMEITEAEIRGVVSKGMLASEKELGLSDDHGGIILLQDGTPHGVPFTEAIPVQDWVFEVDNKAITHRPDLWGHMGIAREVATLTGRTVTTTLPEVTFGNDERVSVTVSDPELCARYLCAYFTGVTIGPSPEWLQCLLRATGVRPISNVVDLTNFVMMDVGNPLHAFDARFVQDGHITVRRAQEGETATTLDGQEHPCNEETLLICDPKGALAVAGIMGGADSEIRDDTAEVILEAANFQARNIRRTATRLGLRTESSARFEKSLDPASAEAAARLFTSLMLELIDGCEVVSPLVDVAAPSQRVPVIHLDPNVVSERLGVDIPVARTREILMGLGFLVQDSSNGTLKVHVPSWRATKDVAIAEDLIEEIGRMHGYENIPPQAAQVTVKPPLLSPAKQQERSIRAYLSDGCGLHEQVSYSFVWRPILEKIGADIGGRLELANAISSDLDRMRRSIIPNLLHATEKNQRYFQEFGLYEVGRVFHPIEGELPCQDRTVAMVIVGKETHDQSELEEAFRSIKGVVDGLIARTGATQPTPDRPDPQNDALHSAWLHPARSLLLSIGDQAVGYLGSLHPRAKQQLGLTGSIHIAELNLDALLQSGVREHTYAPLPKYPGISFDVSFEVDQSVRADDIAQAIRDGANTDLLCDCSLFANYHLDSGRKSVSFHLIFRSNEGSLTDAQVNEHIESMVKHVTTALGAELRGG
jgi:phenylalanyl-tRNA synthetase beta chain